MAGDLAAEQSGLHRQLAGASERPGRALPARHGLFRQLRPAAGQAGLVGCRRTTTTRARAWRGATDVVVTGKKLSPLQRRGIVEDVERGFSDRLRPEPWQTDTCIGSWHYDRPLYERDGYKSSRDVIQRLIDVVSKNGCLLVSIPQRGDGSIDDKEEKVLEGMAGWIAVNGEAIYALAAVAGVRRRADQAGRGHAQNEGDAKPFEAADIRFTTKGGELFALPMAWPAGELVIESLATSGPTSAGEVRRVELLGSSEPLAFKRDWQGPPGGDAARRAADVHAGAESRADRASSTLSWRGEGRDPRRRRGRRGVTPCQP